MTANQASFLSASNQFYDPDTNSVTVDFDWIKGFGSAGEILQSQTLVVAETTNINCSEDTTICFSTDNVTTHVSLGNLLPNHFYTWTVQSFFNTGGNPYAIPLRQFTTIGVIHTVNALMPLPLIPTTYGHKPKPLPNFPFISTQGKLSPISFRPAIAQNGAGGGGTVSPTTNSTKNNNINYCWQYSNTAGPASSRTGDGLALIIAIMLVESVGGHADACSYDAGARGCGNPNPGPCLYEQCIGSYPSEASWKTALYQTHSNSAPANAWGLFQMNVCGGQGCGQTRDFWLNPNNNAQAGVPKIINGQGTSPLPQGIANNGGMTKIDYTDNQLLNIFITSGHPGPITMSDSRFAGLKDKYDKIKFTTRVTNFPLNGNQDFPG